MSKIRDALIQFDVPLKWTIPPDVGTKLATSLVVQHDNGLFYLSFFETVPPLLLGSPEEIEEALGDIEFVEAKCLARFVVSPERMESFIKAMQTNMKRYQAKQEQEENANE